ncbi:hypothetical protein BJ165DRAFT_1523640 [Panaeolus papilionaceus]|nr:hypothetical protein BJ165DRAFT_1523640 [Panaeolus papilionaceus]
MSDNSLSIWSWISASLISIFAFILTTFPSFLQFIAGSANSLTALEEFLALHFGLFLVAIALTLILNVPSPKEPIPSCEDALPSHPILVPLTTVSCFSALFAWNNDKVGGLATMVFAISFIIGVWGMWTMLFANSRSISKTTGADKRTSAFIFGNKAAASSQKKQLKGDGR